MTWREELHLDGKGSFRGIEFFVARGSRKAGRRTVMYQFPGRDTPQIEDLGASAGRSTLVAYVLGDDYMVDRNRLFKAFLQAGAGPLVHPYWGRMTVTVDGDVQLDETPDEGGMARFTLNVIEGGERTLQTVVPDTQVEVELAVDAAAVAVKEDFTTAWDTVVAVTEAVRDAAQDLIDGANGVTSFMNRTNRYANAAMNQVDSVGDAITALGDQAAAIILTPGALVDSVQDIYRDVLTSMTTVGAAWDSYFTENESAGSIAGTPETSPTGGTAATGSERGKILLKGFNESLEYGDDLQPVSETTPQRSKQAGNQTAMTALVKSLVTVETCRASVQVPLASYDQAKEIQDELAAALDDLMDTADDESYNALTELRTAITRHLANASADLPRVVEYTPATALPALVIAHQLYGDSRRDQDIIDRNDLRNPGIVGGGQVLEILSDG
ncbi:MAG: DNA circularization N-terminal domain-containing protein [Gammaproteobacteria bacterium]|nr:DNA circularization N-terminal domain-containing protein [Gammaproteobacteria bacterium]